MPARRIVVLRGGLAAALAAAAALFVVANLVGAKFWTQLDLTRAHLYSLSSQTTTVVRQLDKDVRIVSFLVDGGPVGADVLQQIRTVLEAYHNLNPRRITVESIDPRRDLLRAQALLKDFNLDPLRESIDIVAVRSGARTKQIPLTDLVEFEPSEDLGGASPVRSLKVEGALTAAILAVTRERQPQVRFATGHGERDFQAANEAGLSRFAEALGREDIQVSSWSALGSREVPAGTDLVVVAGPTSPWLPDEREALAKFLRAGGRALLLLEPVLQSGGAPALTSTGLAPLLVGWGVTAEDDIVIDPTRGLPFFGAETFYAPALGLHPVTSSLGGQPVLFMMARSLKIASPTPTGVVANSLFETSPDSWGETNFGELQDVRKDDRDIKGPLVVALAAESKPPEGTGKAGRVVIVGDVDVLANQALDQLNNRSFALNAVSWLIEEERALGIQPKERTLTRLFLTQQQLTSLFVLLVLLLPALAVGAGFGVWWRRKRR